MKAQARAWRHPQRAGRNKIADTPALHDEGAALLKTGYTPKQIEGALRRRHPHDPARRVSHQTIYDFIHIHSNSSVKKELLGYLRRKSPGAVPRLGPKASSRARCLEPSISANCTAKDVARAFKHLPAHLRKTLTYDNGRAMAQPAAFSLATKVAVYFCNPHRPWQRGAVENINGLIREYFPKGIDFNTVPKGQIAKAEWPLNHRLRIVLDGQSPAEVFHAIIQKDYALAA